MLYLQVTVEKTDVAGGQPPTFIEKLKEITATEGDPLELKVKIKGNVMISRIFY